MDDHLDAQRRRQIDGRLWAIAWIEALRERDLPGMDALVLDLLGPDREAEIRSALVALGWLLEDALEEIHAAEDLEPGEWLGGQRRVALEEQSG